ncbi:glycosyltransferase [Geomonas sp. RF6]|uniref:glycosyltransferase n=1 Tax=Geomonas sp. RF6 TaxID=2897342 RepID=UPI001E53505C|nr:glycosyltransferase [Geomonas sp. RF6]UFS69138.1 glycosyltransferase [Geomonas sp. RF6]
MDIAFIIPAKNEEKRISVCLAAIEGLNRDGHNITVVVVDNGSSDNTVEIAQRFHAQVFVQVGSTIAQMRNHGAGRVAGDVVVFVDADVVVAKDFLVRALPHLEREEIGIVTGRIDIPGDSTWVQKAWEQTRRKNRTVGYVQWASSMNMVMKKELFHEIGGFSESLVTCEDVDLCRKVTLHGKKILYDDELVVTHLGEARDLYALYLKEKWRGRSLASITVSRTSLRQFFSVVQFYLFSFALALNLYIAVSAGPVPLSVTLPVVLMLPLYRSARAVCRGAEVRFFGPLIIVWMVYYVARSASLWHGHFQKMFTPRGGTS